MQVFIDINRFIWKVKTTCNGSSLGTVKKQIVLFLLPDNASYHPNKLFQNITVFNSKCPEKLEANGTSTSVTQYLVLYKSLEISKIVL